MLPILLAAVSMIFYLGATITLTKGLFSPQGVAIKQLRVLSIIAVATHAMLVGLEVFTPTGQDLSLINVVSLVCLIISLCVTAMSIKIPAPFLLTVVYGFAAFVQLTTLFFPKHVLVTQFFANAPLIGHITLSLLAYCVLIIATLYALQFQFISRKLKRKDAAIVSGQFPPLMQVEKQQFHLLGIGTILLSAALLTGFIYLDDMFAQSVAHKTILSMIAWLIFVGLLVGHRFRGFRGKSAVTATLAGSIILTLAYFGSRFVKEIILGRF